MPSTYTTADLVKSGIWDPVARRLNHLKQDIPHASDHMRILQGILRVINEEAFQDSPLEYIERMASRSVIHYVNEAIIKMLRHIHTNTTLDLAGSLNRCDRCGSTLDVDQCILDIVHNRTAVRYSQRTLKAAYEALQRCAELKSGQLAFKV